MAQVSIHINGRDYLVACEDGEEKHLTDLAAQVNTQVEGLVQSVGQVGEARLLLMASLLMADELMEVRQEVANLVGEPKLSNAKATGDTDQLNVSNLTKRIEDIAERLERA